MVCCRWPERPVQRRPAGGRRAAPPQGKEPASGCRRFLFASALHSPLLTGDSTLSDSQAAGLSPLQPHTCCPLRWLPALLSSPLPCCSAGS